MSDMRLKITPERRERRIRELAAEGTPHIDALLALELHIEKHFGYEDDGPDGLDAHGRPINPHDTLCAIAKKYGQPGNRKTALARNPLLS